MAIFRKLHTAFWQDAKVIEEITPETAKLIDQDNDLKKEENKTKKKKINRYKTNK